MMNMLVLYPLVQGVFIGGIVVALTILFVKAIKYKIVIYAPSSLAIVISLIMLVEAHTAACAAPNCYTSMINIITSITVLIFSIPSFICAYLKVG